MPQVSKAASEAEAEKQRELIIEDRIQQYQRLANIAFPILADSTELCGKETTFSLGAIWVNKYVFGDDFKTALTRTHGFGDTANLFVIANGSPLAGAGLGAGDRLVAINEWPIPSGKDAPVKARDRIASEAAKTGQLHLVVDTKQGRRDIAVMAMQMCDFRFGIAADDSVNALSDGENILITSGMMRFVQNDVELATVFGHEMAHNVMGHIDKKRGNAVIGAIFDILFAGLGVNTQGAFSNMTGQAYSQEFEAEADYVGLYLMARARIPIQDAPNFWRRMGVTHPGSVALATTHPTTPERFVALEQTVAEINGKIEAGVPLLPETAGQKKAQPAQLNPQAPWQ